MRLSQQKRILNYISQYGYITTLDATNMLNICDPRKRISELRRLGWDIPDVWCEHKNHYGVSTRYKKFYFSSADKVRYADRNVA